MKQQNINNGKESGFYKAPYNSLTSYREQHYWIDGSIPGKLKWESGEVYRVSGLTENIRGKIYYLLENIYQSEDPKKVPQSTASNSTELGYKRALTSEIKKCLSI